MLLKDIVQLHIHIHAKDKYSNYQSILLISNTADSITNQNLLYATYTLQLYKTHAWINNIQNSILYQLRIIQAP